MRSGSSSEKGCCPKTQGCVDSSGLSGMPLVLQSLLWSCLFRLEQGWRKGSFCSCCQERETSGRDPVWAGLWTSREFQEHRLPLGCSQKSAVCHLWARRGSVGMPVTAMRYQEKEKSRGHRFPFRLFSLLAFVTAVHIPLVRTSHSDYLKSWEAWKFF